MLGAFPEQAPNIPVCSPALHPPRSDTAGQAEAAAVLCGVQVLCFCVPLPAALPNVMSAVLMVLPPPWASALPQLLTPVLVP